MTMSNTENEDAKKAAAFLAGFTSSQLFILMVSSGSYAVDRFMLPRSCIGLYINRTIIAFRLSTFIGSLLLNIPVLSIEEFKKRLDIVSTVSIWLYCLSFLALLLIYYNGGKKGHIMYYYCAIIFASIVYGSNNVCLPAVIGKDMPFYVGSIQLSTVMVSAYQFLFTKIAKAWMVTNIPYKLIVGQLSLVVFVSGISAILWSIAYAGKELNGGSSSSSFSGIGKALSPIMLTTLGFGMQNLFYPAIAPYKFIGMGPGSKISMAVLFTSTIPGMTIFAMSQYSKGPNSQWKGWHSAWMFYVLELLLGLLFFLSLHYPGVSEFFGMKSGCMIAVFTILYDWCVQTTRAAGMGGAAMQEGSSNPAMATVNAFGFSLAMLSFAFMGNGYLVTYRQAEQDKDNWPTKHFTTKKAFWYWYSSSAKGAYRACMTSYTRDIRGTILGKKEHLFIVYEDTPPEDDDPFFDLPFIKKKEEIECTPYPFMPPY